MALQEEVSPLAEERRRKIVDLLGKKGGVTVGELVEQLDVTAMTVWRDLKRLEQDGLLRRVRGGAVRPDPRPQPRFTPATDKSVRIRQALARYAAQRFVEDRSTVFLEGGATVTEMVPFLPENLQVITNSLTTLSRLHTSGRFPQVQCSGGILNPSSGRLTGPDARRFFQAKRAELCFLSCAALDVDRGLMDPNPIEVETKAAMAAVADRVIALVDSSKLNRSSLEQVLPLANVSSLVTDDRADKETLDRLRKHVDLHVVPVDGK